ncbi:helix-turn-helix domain-containing protein [Chryseobacterium rhizosphaerae]|uniref:helix-turn-helix domain-containing protein n=1 Tax=Chryseobacterium rhizosphaerae TaxID=395937 RepID=UPI003D101266
MKSVSNIETEPIIDHSFSVKRLDKYIPYTQSFVRLSYHRILILEKGRGFLLVDNESFEISGCEFFLLAKGQIYQFEEDSEITGFSISFGDCFWEKAPSSASNCKAVLFNNATVNQHLKPSVAEAEEILLLCKNLLMEYETPPYINQMDVMAAYLKIIMIKLANIKLVEEETFDSQDYIVYRKFMELLSNQYQSFHAVNNYADLLNITSRRLSEICKRCTHKNAKELINGQIIAEARRLLQFSSYSVKDIAYQLNFGTPEQFSHFFKKNTAISPAAYRGKYMNIGVGIT